MSKLRELLARILLYFDMRYNFIDSVYLRKQGHFQSEITTREYWALVLFWKGVYPDSKFEGGIQKLENHYKHYELIAFSVFRSLLKFLGILSLRLMPKSEMPSLENSIKFEYSQLLAYFNTQKEDASGAQENGTCEADFVIAIPVFNAAEYVRKCVESVVATTSICPILIINDCSTDPRTINYLTSLSSNSRIRIIENTHNLGFARSANIAFKNSSGKHVLLLNSDTVVFGNWLSRIARYFELDKEAWTVTPFSNAATIFSVPFSTETNLEVETSRALDGFLSQNTIDVKSAVSAPTCHGFCVAIHKEALKTLGGFNEEVFGRGYGEENDFSMRVIKSGFSNVIATNTLVHHFGSKSFGKESFELSKANMQKLLELHPKYLQAVKIFLAKDNFKTIRALSLIHLSRSKIINSRLVVSHALGGGVEKSISTENLGYPGLLVIARPLNSNSISIEFNFANSREVLEVTGIDSSNLLQAIFNLILPEQAQIDHILGFPFESIEKFNSIPNEYSVRLHDYIYVCPRIHLSGTNNRDCNLPDMKTCTSCLSNDFENGIDIVSWRMRNISFLLQAQAILAPCEDVRDRYTKVNEKLEISVSPIDRPIESKAFTFSHAVDDQITICILGHLNLNKGLSNVKLLVKHLQNIKSSVRIVHLGNIIGSRIEISKNFVSYGEYEDLSHLDSILKEVEPDVFWFPSEVPETYSYTLSEVLPFQIPISYFDVGAIGERLQNYKWRIPLEIATGPSETLDSILQSVFEFRRLNNA